MAFTDLSFGFKKCSMDRTRLRASFGRPPLLSGIRVWIPVPSLGLSFISRLGTWRLVLLISPLLLPFMASLCCFLCCSWGSECGSLVEGLRSSRGFSGLSQKVSTDRRSEFGFHGLVCACCGSKIRSWKDCVCGCSKGSKEPVVDTICSPKWGYRSCIGRKGVKDSLDESEEEEGDEDDEEEEGPDGDEVMKLRKEIEKETRLRAKAVGELEKERRAAASGAEEAMAKITWLQNEKNFVEREARQYHEIIEQKKVYDRQYIEQFQWLIEKLESEKGEMEGRFE